MFERFIRPHDHSMPKTLPSGWADQIKDCAEQHCAWHRVKSSSSKYPSRQPVRVATGDVVEAHLPWLYEFYRQK